MNIVDAAYATVHDYPGGSESLGPRIDVSPAVLRNKVNPNNETHRLAFDEAVRLSVVSADTRMLDAFAAELNRITIAIPEAGVCDMDLLSDTCALVAQVGEYLRAIHMTLADGKVTPPEMVDVEEKAMRAMTGVATLLSNLRAMTK